MRACAAAWPEQAAKLGGFPRPTVEPERPDEHLGDRLPELLRHRVAELELGERLGERRILLIGTPASRAAATMRSATSARPEATTFEAPSPCS